MRLLLLLAKQTKSMYNVQDCQAPITQEKSIYKPMAGRLPPLKGNKIMNKKFKEHRIMTHKIITVNNHTGNPTTMYTFSVDLHD